MVSSMNDRNIIFIYLFQISILNRYLTNNVSHNSFYHQTFSFPKQNFDNWINIAFLVIQETNSQLQT